MDNQRIEIDYYLAFAPRLRLLRLGERVLSYTFLGTFGSVCVFTWWLNPWIHLPSDWPRWASAWETFSSVWEFLKVFSVNSAIVGVAMTGAVTAMIWNVSFAQKMTNKMDALERRVRWAQRAQQASLSAEQENAAQSSREPQILQVTMPGGLPLDVWRLILARLPLRTISKSVSPLLFILPRVFSLFHTELITFASFFQGLNCQQTVCAHGLVLPGRD